MAKHTVQMLVSKNGTLSANLRRLRILREWTQSKLVTEMQLLGSKITLDTYKKIEGCSRNIKAEDLVAAKTALRTTFEELFSGVFTA